MAYFANGTEGDVLDSQCGDCKIPDDAPCPILMAQVTFNYDQFTDGKTNHASDILNTLVDAKGICQMKPLLDALRSRRSTD
jgi:hypothetical protein